jgi:group I intron endonuclease
MAYIYKITNNINGKVYIGKTENTNPEKRWEEHKKDYQRRDYEKRPLYSAMNKYGINNFIFEILEETNTPEDREIEYIKQYNSYVGFENSNGYNATLGGDGKKYIDETAVISLYLEKERISMAEVAKELGIHSDTVAKILKNNNIEIKSTTITRGYGIYQIDKETNNIIHVFVSTREAARELGNPRYRQHIEEVCKGLRKSAYGYKWKYVDKE